MKIKTMKDWHQAVCERDGYICFMCGKDFNFEIYFSENGINKMVCGDHIRTQGSAPHLKLVLKNGRCVCFFCHTKRHQNNII